MNNIQINSNNNENKPEKPSKKKKILKVLLIVLVCIWAFSTIVQILTNKASADDITLAINGFTTLEFTPTENTTIANGANVGTIDKCTMVEYVPIEYNENNDNVLFSMENITATTTGTAYYIYLSYVIKLNDESQIGQNSFTLEYTKNGTANITDWHNSYISNDYTIISYQFDIGRSGTYTFSSILLEGLGSSGLNNTYDVVCCFIGNSAFDVAKNAVDRCEYENEILNPPTNIVYGTEQIVKTIYNTHTNYQPQDILIPWNNFYLGFICSAVIESTTVDLIYSVAYEDYQYGHGTIMYDYLIQPYI